LKPLSLMSSDDLIYISPRQTPVINRLHDAMEQAVAYADAIRDNAQDEGIPIPPELLVSFSADYDRIITALTDATAPRAR
jgi:citrate lyase beta subunit